MINIFKQGIEMFLGSLRHNRKYPIDLYNEEVHKQSTAEAQLRTLAARVTPTRPEVVFHPSIDVPTTHRALDRMTLPMEQRVRVAQNVLSIYGQDLTDDNRAALAEMMDTYEEITPMRIIRSFGEALQRNRDRSNRNATVAPAEVADDFAEMVKGTTMVIVSDKRPAEWVTSPYWRIPMDLIWITEDGQKASVHQMTSGHFEERGDSRYGRLDRTVLDHSDTLVAVKTFTKKGASEVATEISEVGRSIETLSPSARAWIATLSPEELEDFSDITGLEGAMPVKDGYVTGKKSKRNINLGE